MKSLRILIVALSAVGMTWLAATPAQAQLAGGCTCPAGSFPSGTQCARLINGIPVAVPAICTVRNAINQSVGHIASSQQQQSFWGINQILQQRRDQIQGTPASGGASAKITGYSSSSFDPDPNTLSYSAQSQKNNPLASSLYDQAAVAAPTNPVWGTWLQGLADTEQDGALGPTDVGHVTNTYTAQGGLDRTQQGVLSADDALVLGVVSSWTHAHTGYDGSATTMDVTGPGVGVYTTYVKGGFSTDVTTTFNFLNMTQNFSSAAPNSSVSILSSGLSGNVQYKFTGLLGSDKNFVEPTAGFSLSHTSFGSGGSALGLEDAYTVRLQAGARVGTTWDAGGGISIDASLKALVYGNAIAQGTSVASATGVGGAPTIAPADEGLVRGELDPALSFNLPNDYSVTVSGQLRAGRAILGESVGLNLRKQF